MRTSICLRRLPWLIALLTACGDDTQSTPGSSESEGSTSADASTSSSSGPPEGTGTSSDGSVDTSEGSGSSSTGENLPPAPVDDVYYMLQGDDAFDAGDGGVLSNDVDPESGALMVTSFDAVSARGGDVAVDAQGTVVYMPPAGFFGVDTFEYTASDGTAETSAHVTLYVAPVRAQLADVAAGVGGFVIDGSATINALGQAVAGMGDIDDDGSADLLIGAPYARTLLGEGPAGRSYVVRGKADHEPITLEELESGSGGYAIHGSLDSRNSGSAVANAGDVDGDGIDDILLGDPYAGDGGRAHLVFGKTDSERIDLTDVDAGDGGILILGPANAGVGAGVAGLGDLDADGHADFLVGAPGLGASAGAGAVVFGAPDLDAFDIEEVGNGVRGFMLVGELASSLVGRTVAALGDVNGDGIGDLAVGGGSGYASDPHRSYVVFGKLDEAPVVLEELGELGELGTTGFIVVGDPAGSIGQSIGAIGDIDGDGRGDFAVGDARIGLGGRVYVVLGKPDGAPVDVTQLGDAGFVIDAESPDDFLGMSVAGAGDMNGDGLGDLVVSALLASPNGLESGAAYVVYGDPARTDVDLATLELGVRGFAIDGASPSSGAGFAVAGVGDVDGDGLTDVLVGARAADPTTTDCFAYVVFGVRTAPQ